MSTDSKIASSLELMFLSKSNTKEVGSLLGRNANKEMQSWASKQQLDDYESVQLDFSEALDFVNKQFVKDHRNAEYELNMAAGQKYPKHYIDSGVERYNVEDWRTHDAQHTQEVFRSNANFRYNNEIKQWRVGPHKRHYDKETHETGLKDTRELNTIQRKYNMKDILGPNPYVSSDSLMYGY